MEPLGDEIGRARARRAREAARRRLRSRAWPEAVGDEIARNAWPARIQRDGTLVVHVRDAVWGVRADPAGRRDLAAPAGLADA